MKIRASLVSGLALAGLVAAGAADAQVVTTQKTTTYTGTVSEVNPSASTIILRSESAPQPQTYTYNKETIFTDETGKVVTYESIKDSPVTVQFTRDGDRMIVTKVTKQPSVRKETTTTTTTTTD